VLIVFSFWNIDYVEQTKVFSLKATNTMESLVLAACNYSFYVSESTYNDYYFLVE
jgi:hypothetical protein